MLTPPAPQSHAFLAGGTTPPLGDGVRGEREAAAGGAGVHGGDMTTQASMRNASVKQLLLVASSRGVRVHTMAAYQHTLFTVQLINCMVVTIRSFVALAGFVLPSPMQPFIIYALVRPSE